MREREKVVSNRIYEEVKKQWMSKWERSTKNKPKVLVYQPNTYHAVLKSFSSKNCEHSLVGPFIQMISNSLVNIKKCTLKGKKYKTRTAINRGPFISNYSILFMYYEVTSAPFKNSRQKTSRTKSMTHF